MNKRQKNTLLTILAIAVGFFIIYQLGGFKQLGVVTPKQEYPSPYSCSVGTNLACNVQGVMYCNQPNQIASVVIARSDDSDYSKGWLAYQILLNGEYQGLQSWVFDSYVTRTFAIPGTTFNLSYDYKGIFYTETISGGEKLYVLVPNQPGKYWRYRPGSGADLSSSPKYNCQNQEICSGFINKYSCSGEFRIEKSQNDKTVLYQEPLVYSSLNTPGIKSSTQKTIQPGNIVYVSGGNDNKVSSEVVDISPSCVKSQCNSPSYTGFFKCINNKLDSTLNLCEVNSGQFCSDTSSGAVCTASLVLQSQSLTDNIGSNKSGYAADEKIYYRFSLFSPNEQSASAKVRIYNKQNGLIAEKTNVSAKLDGSANIVSFDGLKEVGVYTIELETISKVTTRYDRLSFRIANPISLAMRAYSESAGTTILYSNEPSVVELRISRDGVPVTANINIVTKQDGVVLNNPQPVVTTNDLDGYQSYTYVYPLLSMTKDGRLLVTATAEKDGYVTTQQSIEPEIKYAKVKIVYSNIALFKDIKTGTYTIEFETRTPQGDLIDSSNEVSVIVSGQTIKLDSKIIQGTGGRYSFPYTFTKSNQGYFFEITSSSQGLGAQTTRSESINVIPGGGGLLECTENTQCSSGKACINNACVIPTQPFNWLWIILGIVAIGIIIVVSRLLKRNKSQVSSSITGL